MSLLSIVIPAYNEEETIVELLELVRNTAVTVPREIIVVNDGSTDRTPELMANWVEGIPQDADVTIVMVNKKNGGKGSAVRAGIEISTGDVVIIQDADMEYDPNDYQSCIDPILSGQHQVVYGSRERFTENRMHSSIAFYAGGLLVTYWMNLIFGSSMTDEPTCYKTFDGDLIRAVLFEGNAFDWEPEITAKLLRLGYHIHEVPICYMPRKVSDGKKITWGDGVEALTTALKWRLRSLGGERQKLLELPAEAPKVAEFISRRKWIWALVAIAFLLRLLVTLPALQDTDRLIHPESGNYIAPTLALLGCLASALVLVPIFRLGEQFASRRVGSAAAILYLLNISSLSAAPLLLPSSLFLLLSAWQCSFFVRFFHTERTLDLWICGAFAGLATLVNGNGFLWILPAATLILLFPRKSFSKRIVGAVGFAVIFIAILIPWMTRNAQHDAGFVLDSDRGSTLYYHKATALISIVTGESAEDLRAAWRAEEVAEFASQPEATEKMRNEYRIKKAEAQIAHHKLLYLRLHFRPNVLLPDLPSLATLLGATQGASFLLCLTPLLAVVAVTYFGFAWQVLRWIRQRKWYLLMMAFAFVAYYLVIAGPIAMPRDQLPALPFMCTMAAIQLFKKRAT